MGNKNAITVSRVLYRWIYIYDMMDILQSDNGFWFKGVYLVLATNFGIQVINRGPKTPCTQDLVEQSNGTVKIRINA